MNAPNSSRCPSCDGLPFIKVTEFGVFARRSFRLRKEMFGFWGFVLLPPWRYQRNPILTLCGPKIRLSFWSALHDRPFSSKISALTVENKLLTVMSGMRRPTTVLTGSAGLDEIGRAHV